MSGVGENETFGCESVIAMSFTFIDLFAGVGGFRKAFESCGGRCVWSCEIDKHARQTYEANYEVKHHFHTDIRTAKAKDIPDHDILLGGFPCQSFSVLGVASRRVKGLKKGINDERQGQLFFEIVRILETKRPAMFLLENVPALRTLDGGDVYVMMVEMLRALGYDVHCHVVNANAWVPQTRKRLFFAGFRDPHSFRWSDFCIPSRRPVLSTILHPEDGSELPEPPYTMPPDGKVNSRYTVSEQRWQTLLRRLDEHPEWEYYADIRKGDEQAHALCAQYQGTAGAGSWVAQFKPHLKDKDEVSTTLTARYTAAVSNTLLKQKQKLLSQTARPRFFTPRECSRLMGFDAPDGADFKLHATDAQAYKHFGNSVVVPCVAAIGRAMLGLSGDDDGEPVSDNLSLW